jgi:hypothetical protein
MAFRFLRERRLAIGPRMPVDVAAFEWPMGGPSSNAEIPVHA